MSEIKAIGAIFLRGALAFAWVGWCLFLLGGMFYFDGRSSAETLWAFNAALLLTIFLMVCLPMAYDVSPTLQRLAAWYSKGFPK